MLFWLCTVLPNCIPVYLPRMANQNSNRLLNLGKLMDMIYDVMSLHQDCRPGCRGPLQWNLKSEDRRGLATRMGILCTTCGNESGRYTLYEEVETKSPGRKPAAVNLGLQVGLSPPLGNDGMRIILLFTNTPPPSRKSLQNTSNKVMAMIESVNEADMSHRCRQLVDVNTLRGSDSPHAIPVQSNGMYNKPLYSGVGETPVQPATQTVYSFAENVTNKHQIIN